MGIDIKNIEQGISDHMRMQPYKIQCSACGYDLDADTVLDSDFDMKMKVDPCKNCLMEATFDDGKNR